MGKTSSYIHYSYDHFQSLIEKGQTAWEAVIQNKGAKGVPNALKKEVEMDAFGFPQITHPAHQYRGGQVSLADTVAASKPEKRKLTRHDLVIVEKNGQQGVFNRPFCRSLKLNEYFVAIEYGTQAQISQKAAQRHPSSSPPRTIHRDASSSFLPPSRQESPPNGEKATRRRPVKRGDRPFGRPRKFLRGTEKFWRDQFGKIRSKKSEGKLSKRAGKMSDPAGLALFASRPPNFDETLVRAMETGLPIPREPDDICQEWVDMASAVLNNDSQGPFVSPKCPVSRAEAYSQIFVIKSSRLQGLRSASEAPDSAARFLTSSVCHTMRPINIPITPPTKGERQQTATREVAENLEDRYEESIRSKGAVEGTISATLPRRQSPLNVSRMPELERDPALCAVTTSGLNQEPLSKAMAYEPTTLKSHESLSTELIRKEDATNSFLKPQPRKGGRPKKSKVPTNASPVAAEQVQSGASRLLGGEEAEPLEEQLEHGVTTRSGRKLPKRSLDSSAVASNPRKRNRTLTETVYKTQKRARTDERQDIDEAMMQSSRRSEPPSPPQLGIIDAFKAGQAQDSGIRPHEHERKRSESVSKDTELIPSQSHETSTPDAQDQSLPLATESRLSPVESYHHNEREQDGIMFEEGQRSIETRTPSKQRTPGSMGGTVALTRRNIIMDLISQCRGAIPNGMPLQYGFVTRWRSSGHHGVPDNRTIETAVKALLGSGKVKRLVFEPNLVNGVVKFKYSMLVRPDMLSQPVNRDEFVKETRKKMEERDPEAYFPEGLEFDESAKKEKRPQIIRRKQGFADIDETVQTVTDDIPAALKLREVKRDRARRRQIEQQSAELLPAMSRSKRRAMNQEQVAEFLPPPRVNVPQRPLRLFPSTHQEPRPLRLSEQTRKTLRNMHPTSAGSSNLINHTSRLPNSLNDILKDGRKGRPPHPEKQTDPNFRRFCSEVDRVERWEIRRSDLFNEKSKNWHFIGHQPGPSFVQIDLSGSHLHFEGLTQFDQDGKEYQDETNYSDVSDSRSFSTPLELLPSKGNDVALLTDHQQPMSRHFEAESELGSNASLHVENASQNSAAGLPLLAKNSVRKRKYESRKLSAKKKRQTEKPTTTQGNLDQPLPIAKRPRGPQLLKKMAPSRIFELAVAIVIVRTLTGGIERSIDWSLVTQCLPNEDLEYVQERWRTMTNKYRGEIDTLGDVFTNKYSKAYERDEVPPLNFDDLVSHDWRGLMEWAMNELRRPEVQEIPDLPSSRNVLEKEHDLILDDYPPAIRSIYNHYGGSSVPVKESAMADITFGIPLSTSMLKKSSDAADVVTIAKSWHRATVLAGTSLDSRAGAAKFSLIPEAVHQSALKSLFVSKTFQKEQLRKTCNGPCFSTPFEYVLGKKRMIDSSMLKRAAWFKKEVMDKKFATGDHVTYEPGLTVDGDMLVIINLAAQGRVKIVPINEPRDRYGLVYSYQTRAIPKEKFYFQVDVLPVEGSYVLGFPISKLLPVPRGDVDINGIIPLWVDIHGRVDLAMWRRILAASVGLIATRPGMSTEELAEMLRPALEREDAMWVTQWLSAGGFVKQTEGGGWETEEWWWTVLSEEQEQGISA